MIEVNCIAEKPLRFTPRLHHAPAIWHALRGQDEPERAWAPIMCSDLEGIAFPGSPKVRLPTCPDCLEALGAKPRQTIPGYDDDLIDAVVHAWYSDDRRALAVIDVVREYDKRHP